MATAKRSGTQDLMQGMDLPDESELDVIVQDLPALSPYLGNVVGYIAGFVCRMVKRKIPCAVCYSATHCRDMWFGTPEQKKPWRSFQAVVIDNVHLSAD
ncbi:hypothetical protein MRX96_056788 [Rhipicephalus microplus]